MKNFKELFEEILEEKKEDSLLEKDLVYLEGQISKIRSLSKGELNSTIKMSIKDRIKDIKDRLNQISDKVK